MPKATRQRVGKVAVVVAQKEKKKQQRRETIDKYSRIRSEEANRGGKDEDSKP